MSYPRPVERAAAHAAAQHGHITSEQCRSCGLSSSAVRRLVTRRAWERVAPGVYRIVGAPPTWHGRALAAVLAAGPESLASHRTAAHLWGLEGFGPPGRIEVTVRRHSRPRRRPGSRFTRRWRMTWPRPASAGAFRRSGRRVSCSTWPESAATSWSS
jgi:predicted transcriptional regulator of viral defense system